MDELTSPLSSGRTSVGPQRSHSESLSYVVGIAAGVGQLGTLKLFFENMPVDSRMAFVIIEQSTTTGTIVTCEMLSQYTEMPVHDVVDETLVECNSVYLIPRHKQIIIEDGRLLAVASDSRRELTQFVDTFFCSLAQDLGERAIGVVLTGNLDDGSHGVLAIGEAGGIVIALDKTAKFCVLTTASVETSCFDLPVRPSMFAEALLKYADGRSPQNVTDHLHDLHSFTGAVRGSFERRPSNSALVVGNAQLEEVLNAATQVSICATDVDGTITLFNSGAENMLGYKSSEMVGKQTPEVIHLKTEVEQRGIELSAELGREVIGFEILVAYAKEGRFERREWTYVRKDGRHLMVNLVVTAIKHLSGEIIGFLGVAEDISERKLSEEALRKSEERFDLAVAGSNDGIWDWDVRTNEVYYAPRFKELLGFSDDEFENTFASFETHLHPDDLEPTLGMVRQHLEHRQPYDVEYRLRTRSGEYRWFRARGQAVWDNAGRAVRMAGSLTDLTKRKHADAALERYAAQVERANHTLRIAEAEARKAVVQRDQFLAMLSHELRNPLSAILNAVGVLEHTDADRSTVDRARQAIPRQIHHMSRLLDDLLDVARITQGKIDFRKEVLDLNDLISEAVQVVQPAMEARRQFLSVIPAGEPVMVEGDPTRLLQIVENLLTIASNYTESVGSVFVELKKEVDHCELCVQDNGRGIDPDVLDEIFDMFFQSDNALDRSDGGIGVGLTLVRTLVELHGGTVRAHSEGLGEGSQFIIRLPLTSMPPAKSREQHSVTRGAANRILLIEDNPDSREMLHAILKLDGFEVEVAEDGQQGLDAILAQRPDVALIDIGLPGLDGYEVARRVRKQLSSSEVHLVALTGYGQAKDREAAFRAGFDDHLVKPVNLEDVERVLNRPKKPR
jgi:PAS domain S-box-containing protein